MRKITATKYAYNIKPSAGGTSMLGIHFLKGYTVMYDNNEMKLGFAATNCELKDMCMHDQPGIINPDLEVTM